MSHRIARLTAVILLAPFAGSACSDASNPTVPLGPAAAKGGGAGTGLYQIRFTWTRTDASGNPMEGEIQSDWFPAAGTALNTNDPWRSLSVKDAVLQLVNHTHGDYSTGTSCTRFADVKVDWDIAGTATATSDPRSFAGPWAGQMDISRSRGGINWYFAGNRISGGGEIRNIASNGNTPLESRDPTGGGGWFQLEFTNARLGFGSGSSPDGQGTLLDLPGYEAACANFTVRAEKCTAGRCGTP